MIVAFEKGDVLGARELNTRLLPSYDFETGDAAPNPVPTKCLMRMLGVSVGPCRAPMGPEPDGLEDRAREVLTGLGRGPA
jgi:4-hydroxy-tetrahydrodipicolinate synthase